MSLNRKEVSQLQAQKEQEVEQLSVRIKEKELLNNELTEFVKRVESNCSDL